jgi:hypothetical protein
VNQVNRAADRNAAFGREGTPQSGQAFNVPAKNAPGPRGAVQP